MKVNLLARFFRENKQKQSATTHAIDTSHIAKSGILGAVIGDIVGSTHEFLQTKSTDFELFTENNAYTDDTVMTIAVADWLIESTQPINNTTLPDTMRKWGNKNRLVGWGRAFRRWLFSSCEADRQPYNSFGNGSGMRVSPCGFYAKSLTEALELAKLSAEVSHNHPEGIKGAQAIASAVFLSRQQTPKEEIRTYIEETFGYDLHRTCEDIRPGYKFDVSCQGSCPEAIIAFLDSHDFESAIRLAISLGGDSDTIGAMTGGIAAAYYGIPEEIAHRALDYLLDDMIEIIIKFNETISQR